MRTFSRLVAALALLALSVTLSYGQGTIMPSPVFIGLDSNGDPVAAGKLCSFSAGTSTPATTYSDVGLTVANANPVILNSAGQATVFLAPGSSYKFVLRTAGTSPLECTTGTTLWTQDNISAVPYSSGNLDTVGTAGEGLSAGDLAYLSDGAGSRTAGRWYKADADFTYMSVDAALGFVVSAISSGSTGLIRQAGVQTGLSLVTGATYYVSGTAGAVTSVIPTQGRAVGVALSSTSLEINFSPRLPDLRYPMTCECRLTLTTATPVTASDVTAATTIYLTPYRGNRIALYDGAKWILRTFTELSIALGSDAANTNYDVFAYDNNGVAAIERLAWTNDTTRATGLAVLDGVYIKGGTVTRRYIGTYRTTGSVGQTEDSAAKRFVWNYQNRVTRTLKVLEGTDSWNYTTATFRQANNSTANQVAVVVGVAEVPIDVRVVAMAANTNAGVGVTVAIGEDGVNPHADCVRFSLSIPVANYNVGPMAILTKSPTAGYHYYTWLEHSSATGTTTWYGDNGSTILQSGIIGRIDG